jgi:hypothetical protein
MSTNYFVANPKILALQNEQWGKLVEQELEADHPSPEENWLHIGTWWANTFTFMAYENKSKDYRVTEALNNSLSWFEYLEKVSQGNVVMPGHDHPLGIMDERHKVLSFQEFKLQAEYGRGRVLTVDLDAEFPWMYKKYFIDAWGYHFSR